MVKNVSDAEIDKLINTDPNKSGQIAEDSNKRTVAKVNGLEWVDDSRDINLSISGRQVYFAKGHGNKMIIGAVVEIPCI